MLKSLCCAGVMLLATSAALADTVTFTANVSGSWIEFPESTQVSIAGFNTSLGTLTGVSDTISLHGTAELANYGPYPGPFIAALTANALLSGPTGNATYTAAPYDVAAGPTSLSAAYLLNASFDFAGAAAFDGPTINEAFEAAFTVADAATGAPITTDNSALSYSGTFSETFTYTPVPEPASGALLATGLLTLAASGVSLRNAPSCRGRKN